MAESHAGIMLNRLNNNCPVYRDFRERFIDMSKRFDLDQAERVAFAQRMVQVVVLDMTALEQWERDFIVAVSKQSRISHTQFARVKTIYDELKPSIYCVFTFDPEIVRVCFFPAEKEAITCCDGENYIADRDGVPQTYEIRKYDLSLDVNSICALMNDILSEDDDSKE